MYLCDFRFFLIDLMIKTLKPISMKSPKIPAKMYNSTFQSKFSSVLDVVERIIVVKPLFVVVIRLFEVVEPFVVD